MDEAALARVESQRLELEGQIAQLRKSLRHWQALELDYEGLKEEFSLLSEDCSMHEALEAADDFAAELVDQQEIRTLFGFDKGMRRTPAQVIDLLSKRVDYVSKNFSTIRKQLSDAEKKRNAILLAKEPEYREEAGLPLTEVTEELDESGNVVSSKLETAQSAAPQLMEVLKKAGVDHLVEKDGVITAATRLDGSTDINAALQSDLTKQNEHHSIIPQPIISADGSQSVKRPPQGTSLAGLDDDSTLDCVDFPTNLEDTEDDAALRREMLEYAHTEIGPIVAQLELDDGASDISYDENEDQLSLDSDPDDDMDEEDESEDEYGRTKSPVISDKYRRKMEHLEKKLGLKGMQNLGPDPIPLTDVTNRLSKPPAAEAARQAAIARAEAAARVSDGKATPDTVERPPKKKLKKVSFADDLDIANEKEFQPLVTTAPNRALNAVSLPPVSGSVVERGPATIRTDNPTSSTTQPRKVSRFKAARDTTPQTPLLPPPQNADFSSPTTKMSDTTVRSDDIMSAAIIERPGPSTSRKTPRPPDPYDYDEALHKQEIAGEYYKSRNKMIQRQGGFVGGGEDDNYGDFAAPLSLVDEETGKVKKISRFKAARLK